MLEWELDLLETDSNKMKLCMNRAEVLQEWAVQRPGRCCQKITVLPWLCYYKKQSPRLHISGSLFLSRGIKALELPETDILLQEDNGDKCSHLIDCFLWLITDTSSPLNCTDCYRAAQVLLPEIQKAQPGPVHFLFFGFVGCFWFGAFVLMYLSICQDRRQVLSQNSH